MNASTFLTLPSLNYRAAFLDMVDEFERAGQHYSYHDAARQDFAAFLLDTEKQSQGVDLPPELVPSTTYWLVTPEGVVIGRSSLRHYLNPALELRGGHIGYAIRPSMRRQGHGTRILALTLEKARELGLTRVLVTCDTSNIASARIIEHNGGILENFTTSPSDGVQISRYWIQL
ncbi:MAG TPA: GNAT family N-acetyltransferase [Anaerolineaceae bacterium]|nr:GNAT family N-acetyltransferase [Anaerolineaceae bacterium]HPN50604.1 GNAT family N-acetyltransferase [Anaerolineaceae bacterium]